MISIRRFDKPEFEPYLPEGVDLAFIIRNYLLFARVGDEVVAVLNEDELISGVNVANRLGFPFPLAFFDRESYEKLYLKFLELKAEKEMEQIAEEPSDIDEEISLVEFLRNSSDLLSGEESAPIIKFVNSLFYQAVKSRASDIHIETHERRGEVRFRIDGALVKHVDLEKNIINLIIGRIKVISNLDISEKRIPQDGRTQIKIAGKTLDVRVSVLPTCYGERVVMRILMQSYQIPTLQELGFNEEITKAFEELLKHSHGMILVTGPTGSGKSTTLHSFMQVLASPEKNIITIEDPVEYIAENLNQIQVNQKVGLTFASGLRSVLRQDPDIIMVGEIRDKETAEIAIKAALTGHLMLSTLHTNNATSAVTRLADMGIDSFLISSSLLGVLAQRLVRLLCPHCKIPSRLEAEYASSLGLPSDIEVYKAKGCPHCSNTGYIGRRAIGELLIIDHDVKSLIKETTDDFVIRDAMKAKGMKFLSDQLKELLVAGATSLDEIIRVGVKDA
ncbi:MAG: GspE/PulE family protein [Campylobacterales bacterium]